MKRHLAVLLSIVVLGLAVVSTGTWIYLNRTQSHIPYQSTPTISAPHVFSSFVGQWFGHARTLTFQPDGHAQYIGRVFHWCGPGVALPCDSMNGDKIVGGLRENSALYACD